LFSPTFSPWTLAMLRLPLVRLSLLVIACASLTACSSTIRWPRLNNPGTANNQRANAEQIDPFPLPDMGPEIVGGRPREFDKPRDEVRRSRQFLESVGARPAAMVPGAAYPVGPPVPIGPPVPMGTPPAAATPQIRY
jgi:hypothetical protein